MKRIKYDMIEIHTNTIMDDVFTKKDWPNYFLDVDRFLRKLNKEDVKHVKVAFLDTGCDTSIPFLKNLKIETRKLDCLESSEDCNGHGTFFASILGQYLHLDDNTYPQITSIKISDHGAIPLSNIIEGLKICMDYHYDVINIGACNMNYSEEMAQIIYEIVEDNTLVISPAGNYIKNQDTYPASLETVASCGAIDQMGKISELSNIHNRIDIFAPGSNLTGSMKREMASTNNLRVDENELIQASGTSFASGILTAFAALLKVSFPTMNNYQFRYLLNYCSGCDEVMFEHNHINIKKKILNFNKLYTYCKNLKNIPLIDMKEQYIKLIYPENYCLDGIWKVELYDIKGCRSSSNGTLNVNLFRNKGLTEMEQSQIVLLTNGEANFSFNCANSGIYYIDVYYEEQDIHVNSIAVKRPQVPQKYNIIKADGKIYMQIDKVCSDYRIFYSFDNDQLQVSYSGDVIGKTFEYIEEVCIENVSTKINIANFYGGIFSDVVTYNLDSEC